MSDLFLTPQQYAEWYARERAAVIEECAQAIELVQEDWAEERDFIKASAAEYLAEHIRSLAGPIR